MRVFLAICAFGMTSAGCPHYHPEAVKLLTKTSMSYDDCLAMHAKDLCDKFRGMFREGPLPSGSRKLLGAPGFPPLPEPDSPITNNAFLAPPLLADLYQVPPPRIGGLNPPIPAPAHAKALRARTCWFSAGVQGYSLIDFVSAYSSGVYAMAKTPPELLGTDMCIWSFQALPPPPGADSQYHFNSSDAQKAAELCVVRTQSTTHGSGPHSPATRVRGANEIDRSAVQLANERFQANVGKDKNDGAVVFGGSPLFPPLPRISASDRTALQFASTKPLCGIPCMRVVLAPEPTPWKQPGSLSGVQNACPRPSLAACKVEERACADFCAAAPSEKGAPKTYVTCKMSGRKSQNITRRWWTIPATIKFKCVARNPLATPHRKCAMVRGAARTRAHMDLRRGAASREGARVLQ
jgi:hypothetical protein